MSASCTRTHTHTAPTGTPQEGARRRATSRPAESPTRGRATLQVADRHTSETSMPRAHPRPQTGGHTGGERAHSRHARISHACNATCTFRIHARRGQAESTRDRARLPAASCAHACDPAARMSASSVNAMLLRPGDRHQHVLVGEQHAAARTASIQPLRRDASCGHTQSGSGTRGTVRALSCV